MLVVPWVTSCVSKPHAAAYAAAVVAVQAVIAFVTHRGWIQSGRFGFIRASSAERAASESPSCGEVVTLEEAVSLKQAYPSSTLVALRGPNRNLCAEAARRARGVGDAAVYVVFVDEMPGLFFPPRTGPSDDAQDVLNAAVYDLNKEGVEAVPVWRIAHDARRVDRRGGRGAGRRLRDHGDDPALDGVAVPARRCPEELARRAARADPRGDL